MLPTLPYLVFVFRPGKKAKKNTCNLYCLKYTLVHISSLSSLLAFFLHPATLTNYLPSPSFFKKVLSACESETFLTGSEEAILHPSASFNTSISHSLTQLTHSLTHSAPYLHPYKNPQFLFPQQPPSSLKFAFYSGSTHR